MSFKTIVEWATGDPPVAGWYNTLIINNKGIPEVMTMKWTNEDKWDNPSWEVKGWCPFPLTCEFMDAPKVISDDPENTPGIFNDLTPEEKIANLAEDLLDIFCGRTGDNLTSAEMVKQIINEYLRNGGTNVDRQRS